MYTTRKNGIVRDELPKKTGAYTLLLHIRTNEKYFTAVEQAATILDSCIHDDDMTTRGMEEGVYACTSGMWCIPQKKTLSSLSFSFDLLSEGHLYSLSYN